jgi:hypothetical protein
MAAAIQTIAPIVRDIKIPSYPTNPNFLIIIETIKSVAIVIPEIGFDELPTIPTILPEIAVNIIPKTKARIIPIKLK